MTDPARRTYRLTCATELTSLAALRGVIDAVCADHPGVDGRTCYDLKLALDEACTNVILHGYAGLAPGTMRLDVDVLPDRVEMTITDHGRAYKPTLAPRPDAHAALEDRPIGGFGLFFIERTMDEVHYQSDEGGNHLTLVRRVRPPRGQGDTSHDDTEDTLGGNA